MIYERLAAFYDHFVDEKLIDIYFEEILKYHKSGSMADLGCGTGPLSIKLSKYGFDVTGTDISDTMLEVAYNNSITENANVKFSKHNILDPLSNIYDVITMVSDVINYLSSKSEIIKAFKNVEEIMEKDSVFIFDFLKLEYFSKIDGHKEKIKIDNNFIEWEVVKTLNRTEISHNVIINNQLEIHKQITFSELEFDDMIKKCNFVVENKIHLEDRIILVCKKRIMT